MNAMSYSLDAVCSIVGGIKSNEINNDLIITDLLFDSRLIVKPRTSLFFAFKTKRNDGHKYICELYKKDVRAFVIENECLIHELSQQCPEATFISTENSLTALQKLTSFHRRQFDIPVIGITGSNGKTIVKEWLYQILSEDFSVTRSPKSYNSQIGVPLSAWQITDNHNIAILEAGISRQNEMSRLREIINPTIGIFTNIGQAHGKNFKDISQKVEEKAKLFQDVDILIYCEDHDKIEEHVKTLNVKTLTWSKKDTTADILITSIDKNDSFSIIKAICQEKEMEIEIPFSDDASIENAIHCWVTALYLNVNQETIKKRMKLLSPIAMRLELKAGINNCTIIDDSYNSDYNALAIALNFMNQQQYKKKRVVILSDILQSKQSEEKLYQNIAQLIDSKGITYFIGIGKNISRQRDKFNADSVFYESTDDFIRTHPIDEFHNQLILIKGAREYGFEKISKLLQEKAHETVLEIDIDNLVRNFNYFRSKLDEETKIMVMVKAFAYGSGIFEISNILEFHRADYLTVAYADEGIELRQKGISLPIMVMTPELNTFENIIINDLEPVIYSFRSLSLLEDAIRKTEVSRRKKIGIHIKIDSGMHRLGFLDADIEELIARIKSNDSLVVKSVFSHLAGSDSSEYNDFSMKQIHLFDEMSERIISAFSYKILRHILNSAGISRFTDYQYDMVRLGIGVYGIAPCEEDRGKLHTVVSLKTTIVQIKEYQAGETIGYGRKGVIDRTSRIGVIPMGYADGLKRQLGNGRASFFVNDKTAPIIGNVCMDMCMIDLTGIDCKEGDIAVLFDEKHPIEDVAAACDTIAYEILTSISQRVKRVYYQE